MSKKNETSPLTCLPSSVTRTQIKRYTLLVALLWFVVVMVSMTLGIVMKKRETRESARIQARSAFEKDILYRRWNAMHGGLYAPITGITPANPYLKIPEREINTPSGKELTKINPAYMTRQVHELGRLQKGVQGHITSLKPIRPQNNPDPWEREALEAFESGAKEVNSIETMDSVVYMRLMRPLVTETGCLKCHAQQGYKEGDIRGGISISVPMEPLLAIARPQLTLITLAHLLLLMIGLCGILLGSKVINRRLHEQELAEAALVDSQQKTNAANIQLQAALKEVKNLAKEAEAANETKSLFLANMSHEIRTPMNGILGITKLLFETNLSDDQRYFSSLIRNSGDALLVVINDILDFSKIEAGKLDLEIIDFNLRSTLNDITDIMALKAEQKKLEFICFVDPKVPSLLRGDPGRLRQVILNLIGN
ncbi:MAG: DUF3365 domain-containing protein, partial [bacterium]|nr:DUF3365 domain-containing protein [bacterium]